MELIVNSFSMGSWVQNVHVVTSNLYWCLCHSKYNENSSRNLFNRVSESMSSLHFIFISCYVSGNHWILVLIDLRERSLEAYDPLRPSEASSSAGTKVKRWYLRHENRPWIIKWKIATYYYREQGFPDMFPKQSDGYSCGPLIAHAVVAICMLEKPLQYPDGELFRARVFLWIYSSGTWAGKNPNVWNKSKQATNSWSVLSYSSVHVRAMCIKKLFSNEATI